MSVTQGQSTSGRIRPESRALRGPRTTAAAYIPIHFLLRLIFRTFPHDALFSAKVEMNGLSPHEKIRVADFGGFFVRLREHEKYFSKVGTKEGLRNVK